MYGPIRTSMSLNQNTDAKFVLLFTKSFTRKLRNEISQFLLIATRMTWPVLNQLYNKFAHSKNAKVVFGREFPQKMWRNVFSDIFFKIQFFCKMAKCTTLSQISLYITHGFPEIIPFPVQLP